jgi:hypothetical protein
MKPIQSKQVHDKYQVRKEILTDIPTEALSEVISDFESEGAELITEQQSDGKWKLEAVFKREKV